MPLDARARRLVIDLEIAAARDLVIDIFDGSAAMPGNERAFAEALRRYDAAVRAGSEDAAEAREQVIDIFTGSAAMDGNDRAFHAALADYEQALAEAR